VIAAFDVPAGLECAEVLMPHQFRLQMFGAAGVSGARGAGLFDVFSGFPGTFRQELGQGCRLLVGRVESARFQG
jgi:hypothetical protein